MPSWLGGDRTKSSVSNFRPKAVALADQQTGDAILTFNAVLRSEDIDPNDVRLVRHQDTRSPGRPTPYNLWRANRRQLELYQRIQEKLVFSVGNLLASFVVTPSGATLFIGLFSVDGVGTAKPGLIDPIGGHDVGGMNLYEIRRDKRLADYEGRLTIEWGKGYRRWVQRADHQNKIIAEITREVMDPPFPGFNRFSCDISEIPAVPLTWQAVLKSVKGVYLLVCKETGKQYVGSARGEENLWGRFLQYAANGHGGNVELKRRGTKPYQVSVLEIVNSDADIESLETAWKQRLLSRKFGLNEN